MFFKSIRDLLIRSGNPVPRSFPQIRVKHSVWDTWLFSSTERLQLVWVWERWSTVECDDDLLHTRALNTLFFLHLHLGLQGRVELIWIQHSHHLFISRLSSLCLCPAVALSFGPFRASSDRYTLLSHSPLQKEPETQMSFRAIETEVKFSFFISSLFEACFKCFMIFSVTDFALDCVAVVVVVE